MTNDRTLRARAARAARWATTVLLAAALAACGGQQGQPPPAGSDAIEITFPASGQVLAGTVPLAASGTVREASDVSFRIGGVTVAADQDGTAYVDTRALDDGPHTLTVSGIVSGVRVEDRLQVTVNNDLADQAVVNAAGGAVMTGGGSVATLPPGSLGTSTVVAVSDTSQADIKDEFGVDYSALGVTFLGALTVDTGGAEVGLPVSVDLAGWANAVQPGQDVVMFALAPDADGDGVGELTLATAALATATGSVITRPVPTARAYGFGAAGSMSVQQAATAKPGEIVRLNGRGFNLAAPLSNVARYGPATSPTAETLVYVESSGSSGFDPLLDVWLAVPSLAGNLDVRVHNLTTGYRTEPLDLSVSAAGSGAAAAWTQFTEQVAAAAAVVTAGRADLGTLSSGWLAALSAHASDLAATMASNSGLVSASNLSTLQGMQAGALTVAQRRLLAHHALFLDAVAASLPEIAGPAADLATLLFTATAPAPQAAPAGLTPQQAGGASCSGGGSTPAAAIVWGQPVTTGMGAAPPGSCAAGNGSGPSGAGPTSLAAAAAALDETELMTTSLRGGSFRPVAGAVVAVYRQGSDTRLAPFTSVTDPTGFFKVPFLPVGEPFTVKAIDPATGRTAVVNGISAGPDVTTPVQLLFTSTDSGPGSPTAAFTIEPVPDPSFEGSVYYDFDATASSDDGEIEEYIWYFDGFSGSAGADPTVRRGFGRNGTYTIRLTVVDDDGNFGTAQQTLVVDDLPYDYWGEPPEHVGTSADGAPLPVEVHDDGFAISADGRYVAFTVGSRGVRPEVDLVPEDTNGLGDVYLKDMETGELRLVSEGAPGVYADGLPVSITPDGRYVAYQSRLNEDGARWRIHVRDMVTGSLETVERAESNLELGPVSLTADGRKLLYFVPWDVNHPTARGVYVHDLDTGDAVKIGAAELSDTATAFGITPSGSHAIAQVYPGIWVVDLETLELTRADTDDAGVPADRSASVAGQALSADGRYVVFTSDATNLVDQATTEFRDHVYLKDLETGEVRLVSRNPSTGAEGSNSSRDAAISADGRFVYFRTYAANLVPHGQRTGPEPDGCSLDLCPNGSIVVYDVDTDRLALAEVGFAHTTSCCYTGSGPIAVGDAHFTFTSYNARLVEAGPDDFMRVFRSVNPLAEP